MLSAYLFFRIRQIGRFLNSVGIGYLIVILILLSGSFLQGLSNLIIVEDTFIVVGFAILLLGIFFQRKDIDFLKSSNLNLLTPLMVDAFLLGIPISIILTVLNKWQAGLGILIVCFLVALITTFLGSVLSNRSSQKKMGLYFSFLPARDFELHFLLRQYFLILIPIYILTIIFSWHIASIFVMSFVILIFLQGVMEYYEPKELITNGVSPAVFMFNKILRIFLWICLALFPFYLIGLYSNSTQWYLYVLVFVSVFVMTAFSVCNKYVFYRPGIFRNKANILSAIMLIFMFIPGFQLVVLLMAILQFFKAKRNLNYY